MGEDGCSPRPGVWEGSKTMMEVAESASGALALLVDIADEPDAYVQQWKMWTGRQVVGVFPMNFPPEIIHASGALPVLIQQSDAPITLGNRLLTEFHCGYTRSIADQAGRSDFDHYDAFVLADHCIQLLGAVDVLQDAYPKTPILTGQLISAMGDSWTRDKVRSTYRGFFADIEALCGQVISEDQLRQSIAIFNDNRALIRFILAGRREGRFRISASAMQAIVKSSMVMDKAEHSTLLRRVISELSATPADPSLVKLHLSGHFCHAPKPALLDLIEDDGALVVDDDLFHGVRYVSTDVALTMPPIDALAAWYLDRNVAIPCPTRVQNDVNWNEYLLHAVVQSGAEAVVVLMAKFCEPHMLFYPELKKALEAAGVPHVLIETEHDGIPVETIRTRMEAMLERIRRTRRAVSSPATLSHLSRERAVLRGAIP